MTFMGSERSGDARRVPIRGLRLASRKRDESKAQSAENPGTDARVEPAPEPVKNERRLFGTDGIRGVANEPPMTPEIAFKVGCAVAHVARRGGRPAKVIVGKDTRLSGYMIETALASGVCAMGGGSCCAARSRPPPSPT